jgi:hypothetical protein
MSDRVRSPTPIGDVQRNILPTRALLLTVQDLLCPARRLALDDAVGAARKLLAGTHAPDDLGAALLSALWESVTCLELAANITAPWVDRQLQSPHGRWAEMTRYDPGRANRFYESSHKWTDQRFGAVSGHRFDDAQGASMLAILGTAGEIDPRVSAAFGEAEAATARFLRSRFASLAAGWKSMRAYAASYEHGLLIAPSEYAQAVEHDETQIPTPILVLDSRKDGALFPDMTAQEILDMAESNGDLAIDVAEYVAEARLRLIDTIEVDGDDVYLRPTANPVPYWVEKGELTDETIELLDHLVLRWREPKPGPSP